MAENREYLVDGDSGGNICISEDVIAVVAATAAAEVEGVAGLYGAQKTENQHGARRSLGHSIIVKTNGTQLTVTIAIVAKLNGSVFEVGTNVQNAVKAAIESACGITAAVVNVRIASIKLR